MLSTEPDTGLVLTTLRSRPEPKSRVRGVIETPRCPWGRRMFWTKYPHVQKVQHCTRVWVIQDRIRSLVVTQDIPRAVCQIRSNNQQGWGALTPYIKVICTPCKFSQPDPPPKHLRQSSIFRIQCYLLQKRFSFELIKYIPTILLW